MGQTFSVTDRPDPSFLRGESTRRDRAEAVAFGTGVKDYSVWVELSFACSNLVNKDLLSLSDPFVVLFVDTQDGLQEVGRTEIIPNDLNPKFVRSFQVLFEFERIQRFKVMVFDADQDRDVNQLVLKQQDFLGRADFKLTDVVTEAEGKVELDLLDDDNQPMQNSQISIYYEEQNNQSDEVKLVVGATLLSARSAGAFYRISKQHIDDTWLPVYRSEVARPSSKDGQYYWKPLDTRLRGLCNANVSRPLLVEILMFRNRGAHQVAGKAVLSLNDIEALANGSTDLMLDKQKDAVGSLHIRGYERLNSPSFLEYVAAGFEICFLVAIDFTRSNGSPEYPGSLHHVLTDTMDGNRRLNVYEEAIHGVGKVLEAYDTDQLFPTWGFGAKLHGKSNTVSHCFAVNGNPAAPECHGVQGILEAYREALNRVTLAGPTFFSPVLKAAATMAARDNHRKYYCLLLITDGVLLDFPRVKREIIAASSLPLSIMLVGVGNEDFSKMVELDSDEALLSEDGVHAERDIVQFVEFEKYKNNGEELAQELLAEFPGQFLSYMKKHNIMPHEDRAEASLAVESTSILGRAAEVQTPEAGQGAVDAKIED